MTAIPEIPHGAIENGRVLLQRLADNYEFTCEAGSLANCTDYHEAVRCFEFIAQWISEFTAAPFLQGMNVEKLYWRSEPPYHMARTKFGGFYCIEAIWNENKFVHAKLDGSFSSGKTFPTLEEAKSSAQSDYEARVLSAIQTSASHIGKSITDKSRLDNTARNRVLNRTHTDLENIINGHDPEVGNLNNDIWDRLDKMALEIEALSEPSPRAQALEEAAKIADKGNTAWLKKRDVTANKKEARDYETMAIACSHVAAAIRALSSQPVADGVNTIEVTPSSGCVFADMGVERPVADGWLPIETAPKDGTEFLAWPCNTENGVIVVKAYWYVHPSIQAWITDEIDCGDFDFSPTHWRPLPASPGASSTRPTGGSNHGE